jgi:hypothetical protein
MRWGFKFNALYHVFEPISNCLVGSQLLFAQNHFRDPFADGEDIRILLATQHDDWGTLIRIGCFVVVME